MSKPVVIILNHAQQQCGVYQYGKHTFDILKKSEKYEFRYYEVEDAITAQKCISASNFPWTSVKAVIYNYHPLTMPWLGKDNQVSIQGMRHLVIHHEGSFPGNIHADKIITPDCTVIDTEQIVGVPRPLFKHDQKYYPKAIPIIATFGFGFGNKGFGRVVKQVNEEFDQAIIRMHIPRAYYGDRDGQATAQVIPGCEAEMKKPGIQLHISHNFMNDEDLLEFLAQSSVNVFLYDEMPGRGLSSVIDYALSVRVPLAINRTTMFRHIYDTTPSICIEDNSLKQIIANGPQVTDIYRDRWSHREFINKYENIID